jgi:hypothetical protein
MNRSLRKSVLGCFLMGTAALLAWSGCGLGKECHPSHMIETISLVDGGLPAGLRTADCSNFDLDAGTAQCDSALFCLLPLSPQRLGRVSLASTGALRISR